jgi:hypothetical protein
MARLRGCILWDNAVTFLSSRPTFLSGDCIKEAVEDQSWMKGREVQKFRTKPM